MRVSLTILFTVILMGTSPKVVKGQDPGKLEDVSKVFLEFFKLNKIDKKRTEPITQLLIKRKSSLEKNLKKLSGDEKQEHSKLTRDVAIWNAGYNVYKMTDKEKNLAAQVLFKK